MRLLRPLVLTLVLAACSEPKKQVDISEAIPNLPVPPAGELILREGGEDALKFRFRSTESPAYVADYYRSVLGRAPWTLVSDVTTADGVVSIYAEQAGPSLWVTVRKADGAAGSFIDIAGAKPGS